MSSLTDVQHIPPYLTIRNVAALLAVSCKTVRRYLSSGRLRGIKLSAGRNGAVRVCREELHAFLAAASSPSANGTLPKVEAKEYLSF